MTRLTLEARFSKFPTSAISDALDEKGLNAVIPGVHAQRVGQGRIVGRALPVKLAPKSADPDAWRFGGGVGKPLEQVLQTMKAGDVVIMDLGGTQRASAWGGLASRLALTRGVRGTIMWGTCRDVEEIRACGYPVWAVGTCPRRSRNEFTFGSINEAITIAEARIAPGDIVVADESGVVIVPQDLAEEVLTMLERIAAQEAILEDQVTRGEVETWDEL